MIKVGFPRSLLYYDYFPLWSTFFEALNIEVISSPNTNKEILNDGIECCVDEACLPVKLFHGHVSYLKDKVDYIFVPKYISLYKKEYNCPKHLGIADMVLNSIDDLPPLISPKIELKYINEFRGISFQIGSIFTHNYYSINKAYNKAINAHKLQIDWLKSVIVPQSTKHSIGNDNIRLLILGHSYNIFDDFVNMETLNKLAEQGIEMIFSDEVKEETIRKHSDTISKRIFWSHGRKIIGSAYSLIEDDCIDGIIYLSAFGCGLDSILINLVEDRAIKNNIPIMIMTFDEQTGEAGVNTRLEAFLDMMKWRLKIENNFSAFR